MVSYGPKKGRAVILASSMQHLEGTDDRAEKSETIVFCNFTKGAYSYVFYRILDISMVNAYVVHQAHNMKIARGIFLKI